MKRVVAIDVVYCNVYSVRCISRLCRMKRVVAIDVVYCNVYSVRCILNGLDWID